MKGWRRVNKECPCPICEKPDWCTIGNFAICCMRVSSSRPVANGGYLHPLDGKARKLPPVVPDAPSINTTALMRGWSDRTNPADITAFAILLSVTRDSLISLGIAWASDYNAWAFPMRDGHGDPCGIRLRSQAGYKWSVTGGRQGIFLPDSEPQQTAYICEGPTDTAAALSLGLFAMGRPSCSGAVPHIVTALRRLGIDRAVILSDNDLPTLVAGKLVTPGQDGAKKLAESIPIPSCITVPPAKDIREFLRIGGTRAVLESMTNSLVWNMPKNSC